MEKHPERKVEPLPNKEREKLMREELERRIKEQAVDPEADLTAGK